MWAAILQAALDGMKSAPSRRELIAYGLVAAICIAASVMLGGCSSSQMPSVSIDVVPAGSKTQAAPAPAPQIVVVPSTPAAGASSVPQK